jgi:hypothetical protein
MMSVDIGHGGRVGSFSSFTSRSGKEGGRIDKLVHLASIAK